MDTINHITRNIFCFFLTTKKKHWTKLVGCITMLYYVGKIPGGGHGNPLQYSCLENPHVHRNLVDYSPWGCRVGQDWVTKHTYICIHTSLSIKIMYFITDLAINRYFWTVVLEKTLESHLDSKKIQSVHPKGNQS